MSKTKQRLFSLTLVAAMFFVLAIPASARASAYIDTAAITTKSLGNGKISIRLDVVATTTMNEVGATQIIVNEKGAKGGTNHEKGQPVIHSVLSGDIGAVCPVGGAGGFFLGLDHGDAAL